MRFWTPEEVDQLRLYVTLNMSSKEIAPLMDRTLSSITQKRIQEHIYLPRGEHVPVADIRSTVAKFYRVSEDEMLSPKRHRYVARPRQVAIYLSRKLTPLSLPTIARRFKRDHTTIMHSIRQVEKLIASDERFAHEVQTLEDKILSTENAKTVDSSVSYRPEHDRIAA